MRQDIPVEIQEQMIDTLCTIFWYKKPLMNFLANMGIPQPIFDEMRLVLRSDTKRTALYFLIGKLLALPDNAGLHSIDRILQQLSNWSRFKGLDNPEEAREAVLELKRLITKYDGIVNFSPKQHTAQVARQEKLEGLKARYLDLNNATNPQRRGLDLESLVYELFELEGLNPSLPFSLDGEQIDGAFELDNYHYLVETKWEQSRISPDDVAWFKVKLERRFSGTRGLMIAINGFTSAAIRTAQDAKSIILMDGYDLYTVLDPMVDMSLKDLLSHKISSFSRQGIAFMSVRELLS